MVQKRNLTGGSLLSAIDSKHTISIALLPPLHASHAIKAQNFFASLDQTFAMTSSWSSFGSLPGAGTS